jgi:hypothetical protein
MLNNNNTAISPMKIFKLSGGAKWGSTFAQRMEEQTNDFVITRASKSLALLFQSQPTYAVPKKKNTRK